MLRRQLLLLCLVIGHGCTTVPPTLVRDVFLTTIDTIVPPESLKLGRAAELALDEAGRLYITDLGVGAVVVMDTSGALIRRIGREGSGPGEFRNPRSLFVAGDSLRLVDAGNGRLAVFTTAGQFVRSQAAPDLLGGAVSFALNGAALVALNGREGALARRLDPAGARGSKLGQPVLPVTEVWDFGAIKREIREGRIPAELRNLTQPLLGADASCWLLLHAEGVVQHYNPADSLLWRTTLHEPELRAIRDAFFATNRSDSAGNRLTQLSYFVVAQASADELWILIRQPSSSPTLVMVLGPDGRLRRRVRVPSARGVRGMAFDPRRRLLYLLAYDDAAILRARVP
jgi:hypothetical protein